MLGEGGNDVKLFLEKVESEGAWAAAGKAPT